MQVFEPLPAWSVDLKEQYLKTFLLLQFFFFKKNSFSFPRFFEEQPPDVLRFSLSGKSGVRR